VLLQNASQYENFEEFDQNIDVAPEGKGRKKDHCMLMVGRGRNLKLKNVSNGTRVGNFPVCTKVSSSIM